MPDPIPSEGEWAIWVCRECGWHILDENAVEDQPCEAWLIDPEIPEHGVCERVEVVPRSDLQAAQERAERAEAEREHRSGDVRRAAERVHADLAAVQAARGLDHE